MLSTAHRILDGSCAIVKYITRKGLPRKKKVWSLADKRDSILYKVAHPNHPSTKWTMACAANYHWHYRLFIALCNEYTLRYHKIHKTDRLLRDMLADTPRGITRNSLHDVYPFALAMKQNPECIDHSDPVGSYRKFYETKQARFKMVWTNRPTPPWFNVSSIIH